MGQPDMSAPRQRLTAAIAAIDDTAPSLARSVERASAFRLLGSVLDEYCGEGGAFDLHEVKPNPVWDAVSPRIEKAIDDAGTACEPSPGAKLWQLYNSGVLVSAGGQILGFDVIPMPRFFGWDEPEGLTDRIAKLLGALFITHRHEDHCDMTLIKACLRHGTPVFLPKSVADSCPPSPSLHPMEDGSEADIGGTHVTGRLGYHVWRENLNDPPLIYYEATLRNGFTLIFGGDVDYTKRFECAQGVEIDLAVLPWRAPNSRYEEGHEDQESTVLDALQIAAERVRPAALLHNHYGELDHIYSWGTGASYDMAIDLKQHCPTPSEVLFWGESLSLAHHSWDSSAMH